MANELIADLTAKAGALDGTELLEIDDGSASLKVTAQQIADLASGSGVPSVNGITSAVTISGAGVSTAGSTITISSSGGGLPILYFEDYGADPTGVADSTTAVQDCLDAAGAAGGGICMPSVVHATYLIGGALQDTSHANAQLLMPAVSYVGDEPMTVKIAGWIPPSPVLSVIGSEPLYTHGLRFKSTLTSGPGNVFGASNGANFTNVLGVFENLTVELPDNPVLNAVNGGLLACMKADEVFINTGNMSVGAITTPSHATYGLIGPSNGNGAYTDIGTVNVIGFGNGYEFGEHTVGKQVNAWGCINHSRWEAANHASRIERAMAVHCQNGLVGAGEHYLQVAQFDLEHAASGPFAPVHDIEDASNYLRGEVAWHVVLAGVGTDRTFVPYGAANLSTREIGRLPGIRDFSGTTDTATALDINGLIRSTGASAAVATIPSRSSIRAEPGIRVFGWVQQGTGQLTIAAGSGVTIGTSSSATTRSQYSIVYAIETAPDVWLLTGDLT